eukprot:TRINITY_DN17285_c0_g1_i2.p1 TRINITY_DN17285_c0_g1~~TRINITY_DN17285_c0_g1_i2.p1  ORF type:complete len:232 (+),score=49.55 TRINITY_DN17285_c0_g1_i2:505-1200(+)
MIDGIEARWWNTPDRARPDRSLNRDGITLTPYHYAQVHFRFHLNTPNGSDEGTNLCQNIYNMFHTVPLPNDVHSHLRREDVQQIDYNGRVEAHRPQPNKNLYVTRPDDVEPVQYPEGVEIVRGRMGELLQTLEPMEPARLGGRLRHEFFPNDLRRQCDFIACPQYVGGENGGNCIAGDTCTLLHLPSMHNVEHVSHLIEQAPDHAPDHAPEAANVPFAVGAPGAYRPPNRR